MNDVNQELDSKGSSMKPSEENQVGSSEAGEVKNPTVDVNQPQTDSPESEMSWEDRFKGLQSAADKKSADYERRLQEKEEKLKAVLPEEDFNQLKTDEENLALKERLDIFEKKEVFTQHAETIKLLEQDEIQELYGMPIDEAKRSLEGLTKAFSKVSSKVKEETTQEVKGDISDISLSGTAQGNPTLVSPEQKAKAKLNQAKQDGNPDVIVDNWAKNFVARKKLK